MDETRLAARGNAAMHVGVVHGSGGIHFLAVADSRTDMMLKLSDYVRSQAVHQLYARDAAVVADLLERAEADAAVRFYFDHVGERWDRETLTLDVVAIGRTRDSREGTWRSSR